MVFDVWISRMLPTLGPLRMLEKILTTFGVNQLTKIDSKKPKKRSAGEKCR
jgi:hypothetical protein